ncbi:hypothetical protein [Catellatospora sp. TT07R-123]|uniref:hypothetical protein n=1 Tax=Catellatospora sp. TT07R-123 TaxID=2733863 RepID=UPI001BB31A09|nr:hypothetical protein [Catellatospora sp. TT07R-123]
MLLPPTPAPGLAAEPAADPRPPGPRWRTFLARSGRLFAPLAAMLLAAAISQVIGLPHFWAVGVLAAAPIGAGWVAYRLGRAWGVRNLAVATAVVAGLGAVGAGYAAPLTALTERGVPTVAVVQSKERDSRWLKASRYGTHRSWRYRLVAADGRPIAGELVRGPGELRVGDRVEVVYDPRGRIEPQLPAALSGAGPVMTASLSLVLAAVPLGSCAVGRSIRPDADERLRAALMRAEAARSRRRPSPPWFRPLGRTRRVVGRVWCGLGLVVAGAGVAAIVWGGGRGSAGDDSTGPVLAVGGGWFGAILGVLVVLLSLGPAFGRDTRTR